jgi:hypothetical protein
MSNTAVFGIYHTRPEAEEAVNALLQNHFRNTDISALFPDNAGTKDFALEKNTKAPEGAATGGLAGAIAGGVLGWLAGAGFIAVAGIEPYIAAGPVISALAGAGALGLLSGLVGALVGMSVPEYEARRYRGRVKHGGVLLSVHCDNREWVKRAEQTLKRTGAEHVSSAGEAPGDFGVSDRPLPRTRTSITDPAATHSLLAKSAPAAETPVIVDPLPERIDPVPERINRASERINPDGYRQTPV